MKKLIAIVAAALSLGAYAGTAADPVITADTSAVDPGTTCTVMADNEELFDLTANGGNVTMELDEVYVGRRICLTANGEEITDSTTAQMGAANDFLRALPKMAGGGVEVGDAVVWSNTDTTKDPNVLAYGTWELCLRAKDGMPNGSTVALSSIQIAERPNHTYTAPAFKIIIPGGTDVLSAVAVDGGTMEVNAKETPDTRDSVIYKFDPAVELTVGVTYKLHAADAAGNILANSNNGGATGVNTGATDWAVRWQNQTGWMPVAIVTGKFTAKPARDPIDFTFDASTQTWSHELPTEFMVGDTLAYTGTGDATLAMDVTVPLTVGAGVNLSISGDVTISGKSKFAAGSTLTVASGTTTISNAQSGRPNESDRGLMGTIVIESGATLSIPKNDSIDYNGTTKMIVKGTLAGGAARQTINANNTIELHQGAKIEGAGAAYSTAYTAVLDVNQNATFTVNGTAAINAPVGIRAGVTLSIKKAEGATSASVSINADNKILGPGAITYEGITGMDKLPAKYATQGGKKITLKDCAGWINWARFDGEVTISGTFTITNGSSTDSGTIKTLKGDGNIAKTWDRTPVIYIEDHSGFTGAVTTTGVHLSRAKSESAYYYTIVAVKAAVDAGTEVINIDCTEEELGEGYEIVDGKIVASTSAYPDIIEDGSTEQQVAYVAWATAAGVTDPTTKGAAEAFALKLTADQLADKTVEQAVKDELDDLLETIDADKDIDLLAIMKAVTAGEGNGVISIDGYENATIKLVTTSLGDGVTTDAKLFKLSVEFKPAN